METVSLRHSPAETALPIRRLGSFLPGTGLGGAGEHWNGITWRLQPSDHLLRSHLTQRYGKNAIPEEMTIEDFPVSYDELEPYYDRFEKLAAFPARPAICAARRSTAATCSRVRARTSIPTSRSTQSMAGSIMEAACRSLGYHPFPGPAANMPARFTPIPKASRSAPATTAATASVSAARPMQKRRRNACILPVLLPDPKFELRTYAYVKELVYDKQAKKVKAVRYVDTAQRRGIRAAGRASSSSAPMCSTTCC